MNKAVARSQSTDLAPLSASAQLSSVYKKVLQSKKRWNKQLEEQKGKQFPDFLVVPKHYSDAVDGLEDGLVDPLYRYLASGMQQSASTTAIAEVLSVLMAAFPNVSSRADMSGFGKILMKKVCETAPPLIVLETAVDSLIETCRFPPSVAEVLEAISNTKKSLGRLEEELAYRREQLRLGRGDLTDAEWERHIRRYYECRARDWPPVLGPNPDASDCRAPAHVLHPIRDDYNAQRERDRIQFTAKLEEFKKESAEWKIAEGEKRDKKKA